MNKLILALIMMFIVAGGYAQDKTRTHNPYSKNKSTYSQTKVNSGVIPDPTAPPTPPAPVPIDGGTGVLLAAGVGFGIRKLLKRDRKA